MNIEISDPALIQQIERIARQERRDAKAVLADALRLYEQQETDQDAASGFLMAIAGLGASSQPDVSERDEEILASEVDAVEGWRLHNDESAA